MLRYEPPLRDLAFGLGEVLDAPAVLRGLPAFAEVDLPLLLQVAEAAGRFAAEQVLPLNALADAVGCRWTDGRVQAPPGFADAWAAFREQGWPGLCAPVEEGGQGLPALAGSVLGELLSSASHAFVMFAGSGALAAHCLRRSASPALQAEWMPRLASGQALATMCISEPQAGSDVGLARTRAAPSGDGDGFRLHGTKVFASGGEHDLTEDILHLVLARLPDAPAGSRGLSLFACPRRLPDGRRNAVHCDGIEHKMGLHGSPTCTLRFDGAQAQLVGSPHQGLRAMFPMMNEARLMSGLQAVGLSETGWQNALAYAHERRQGRAPGAGTDGPPSRLVDHPDVQRLLATQKAWTEGGRLLCHWTALLLDVARHHPDATRAAEAEALVGLLTPLVKGVLSENAQLSLSAALQVHGGHGYVRETGIEQLVRDARIVTIYEGTTGIQAQDLVLRKLLGDGGHAWRLLRAEVTRWLDGPGRSPALADVAMPLQRQRERVDAAITRLQALQREAPAALLAACTPALRLVGLLVLALLWARAAEKAGPRADVGDPWHRAKRATALFFLHQLLPEAEALAAVIHQPDTGLQDTLLAA
ncbi:acyl-CoA dehydrogenase [Aquabacterium sp. J223]|uniref:acyl-CoA dehydrogenase n=1 Tax=Aquabacterium sp. J223 TaxID=2898431 RepID=UPI0021ADACE3|nr:acyl-CoA dehydrogenase [Aquabacterium sp. J223]UUX94499.1 acyl-CoA dehydrogenase [Aquabacterium sp. J223]